MTNQNFLLIACAIGLTSSWLGACSEEKSHFVDHETQPGNTVDGDLTQNTSAHEESGRESASSSTATPIPGTGSSDVGTSKEPSHHDSPDHSGEREVAIYEDFNSANSEPGGAKTGSMDGGYAKFLPDISKTFRLGGESAVSFKLRAGGMIERTLIMGDQKTLQGFSFQQASRPSAVDTFYQGTSEVQGYEAFTQPDSASGPLDILIIVDNSGSMAQEQTNLSTKLTKLLTYVADSNWRISIETTDPADSCGRYVISKGDPGVEAAFQKAVTRGTSGSGNERGVLQAVNGLRCNMGHWLRPRSMVAILILSDEDNCSDGKGCGSDLWASGQYLIDYLSQIREVGVNARVFGLIWDPAASSCNGAAKKGVIYKDIVTKTHGTVGSVCDEDYSSTLNSMSASLQRILNTQFTLRYAAASAVVKINGVTISSGYKLTGQVLTFDEAPRPGDRITVDYQYKAQSLQSSFKLAQAGPYESVSVEIDRSRIDTSQYNFDQGLGIIEFASPPQGLEVKVSYRYGTVTNKTFTLNSEGMIAGLRVYIDGKTPAMEYALNDQTLTFASPPPESSTITAFYTQVSGVRTFYRHYVPRDALGTLVVTDSSTNSLVPFTLDGDFIVFADTDFRLGRDVTLHYRTPSAPLVLDSESRVIEVSSPRTSCPLNRWRVVDNLLDISDCGFAMGEDVSVFLQKPTYGSGTQSFLLWDKPLDQTIKKEMLKVSINGQDTKDYEIIQNDTLRIELGQLTDGDIVFVRLGT